MQPFARGMIGEVARLAKESGRKRTKDLLVITLVRISCALLSLVLPLCDSSESRSDPRPSPMTSHSRQDHRNHGTRLKHKNTNLAYERNPHHFIDMAATICTCRAPSPFPTNPPQTAAPKTPT